MKNRKKAVVAIVAAVLLLVVLLFPIRMNLKDGGSVQYKSLTFGFYLPELKMADLTNCNAASYTQWTFQEKTA